MSSDVDSTYVFLPPSSSHQHNCNGVVNAFQYCFRNQLDADSEIPYAFVFFNLRQLDISIFQATNVLFPDHDADNSACSSAGNEEICCAVHNLSSAEQFHISSGNFTFGLRIVFAPLLIFSDSFTEFEADTFLRQGNTIIVDVNDTFIFTQRNEMIRPVLLFRLILRK